MTSPLLSFAVLASLCVSLTMSRAVNDDLVTVRAVTGADSTLPCPAKFKPGVSYLAVRWYKVHDPTLSRLNGILTRDLPNGKTQYYLGLEREVDLLENSTDIFLPNITCADGGLYICHLAAPVGEQNRERQVLLTVSDCSDTAAETEILLEDAYMVVAAVLMLLFALLFFRISYVYLKKFLKEGDKKTKQETLLDGRLKPLDKKDLMLIYTLGPKQSKTSTMKHICV